MTLWQPELDRVNRVIVKNARGHVFYEYGEPRLQPPDQVLSVSLPVLSAEKRAAFENLDGDDLWPEVGSRMMTRYLTGQDLIGGWVVVQDGVYRYAVIQANGLLVRSVLNEYLATEVFWGQDTD